MTRPTVSIVLPTFNGARYLERAIESCLAQTCPDWELILVDDASTDRTPELIAGYAARDSRIRSVRHAANKRLPAALNTGFGQAAGEYLSWTSDDNCYMPRALERMLAFLTDRPDVDVVYSDYIHIDEQGRETGVQHVPGPEHLRMGNTIGPSFLYHRRVAQGVGPYSEDLFLAEDFDFWLRAAKGFRFERLPEPLYLYRHHGDSLSRSRTREAVRAGLRALRQNLSGLPWCDRQQRVDILIHMSRKAMMHGAWTDALRYAVASARLSPAAFSRIGARRLWGKVMRGAGWQA